MSLARQDTERQDHCHNPDQRFQLDTHNKYMSIASWWLSCRGHAVNSCRCQSMRLPAEERSRCIQIRYGVPPTPLSHPADANITRSNTQERTDILRPMLRIHEVALCGILLFAAPMTLHESTTTDALHQIMTGGETVPRRIPRHPFQLKSRGSGCSAKLG